MMKKLFTERHGEGKARVAESLDDTTREGLLTLVSARIDEEWFGLSFNQEGQVPKNVVIVVRVVDVDWVAWQVPAGVLLQAFE